MNNERWEHEVKRFLDYAKRDPRVLIAGGVAAVVLIAIGAPKVVALATGAVVAGVIYSNEKRKALCAH